MGFKIRAAACVGLTVFLLGTVVLPVFFRAMSAYGPIPESTDALAARWLAAHPFGKHGPHDKAGALAALGDAAALIERYERDGYVVVPGAVDKDTVEVLRALVDYSYEEGNLSTRWTTRMSCLSNQFDPAALIPRLKQVLLSLPIHWAAQRLMGADAVTLVSDIVHANPRNCDGLGYLSTHSDMNTTPFNMTRTRSTLGDNSMVVWVALDQMSEQTVTMAMVKGSHRFYEDRVAASGGAGFRGDDYCDMWMEHLDQEKAGDRAFLKRFETVELNAGDALFFHGLAYHSPLYSCKGPDGCTLANSRRLTLRYVDSDRTVYRTDEGRSSHHQTRRCGVFGVDCRYQLGRPVRESKSLPIVVDTAARGVDLSDRLRDGQAPEPSPLTMYLGSGLLVHHQTCGIEHVYAKKLISTALKNHLPAWATAE